MAEEEELVIKEVSYEPGIELPSTKEEEEEEDTKLIYHIPSRHPSFSGEKYKIIRDGCGVYKTSEDGPGDGKVIYRFTLINNNNITVQVMTYGATITSIQVPDKKGNMDDIVLGFDNLDDYRSKRNPYFGATIGRITGVIPQYVFSIEGEKYYVSNNYLYGHHANGGFVGFDKVLWNHYISTDKLYFSYMSKDMEEGFPGDVLVNRSYELTQENELIIKTSATCTRPTPIDVTTHIDWNLSSHLGGPSELYKHYLMVNADKYAQVNNQNLLTGKLKKVSGTILDIRIPRPLGKIIHKVPGGGFDHYLSLTRGSHKSVVFAAKLSHPDSGRYLEVFTDQPGLQIYTQNNLYASKNIVEGHPISCWCHDPTDLLQQNQPPEEQQGEGDKESEPKNLAKPLEGKLGSEYVRHGGIRLVPVNYPEPIARDREHIQYLISPGETYENTTIYKFGVTPEKPQNLAEITA